MKQLHIYRIVVFECFITDALFNEKFQLILVVILSGVSKLTVANGSYTKSVSYFYCRVCGPSSRSSPYLIFQPFSS
jgi:hypothetical protein